MESFNVLRIIDIYFYINLLPSIPMFVVRKPWRDIFIYYLLLITYYLSLITYYLLLITYHLLLTTYHLLLITCLHLARYIQGFGINTE